LSLGSWRAFAVTINSYRTRAIVGGERYVGAVYGGGHAGESGNGKRPYTRTCGLIRSSSSSASIERINIQFSLLKCTGVQGLCRGSDTWMTQPKTADHQEPGCT
jgi:hypothetical protein